MILGLSGLKGSGKDTVAAYLVKTHGFERKAFADPMKKSIAALFDIPFSEIDKFKNDDTCEVALGYNFTQESYEAWTKVLSFREFLQRYGTESHREIFGKDFWVDQTLPVQGYYPGRAIVVTDVRFANEAARVNELGGFNIRVVRDRSSSSEDNHVSEQQDFEFDFKIYNDGDLEELYDNIETVLVFIGQAMNLR
jgi:hypothetical protein